MKRIIHVYRTQCLGYPPKWEVSLFDGYVTICNHFPKVWSWGVEVHFERGCNGLSYFWKYWQLGYGNDNTQLTEQLGKGGKVKSTVIRFGKPLITIHFTKASRDRAVEAISRYIYKPKTQQYA